MKNYTSIQAMLETIASQQQMGETSLTVRIEPGLIQDAMNSLQDYRKLFAPVIPGQTDTAPLCAAFEQMQEADVSHRAVLVMVECKSMEEYRDALSGLPIRNSSEWRSLDDADFWDRYLQRMNGSKIS